MKKQGLKYEDYERASKQLNCEIEAIMAVAEVESSGSGFLVDGRPKILYERHIFHRLTLGKWSASHPHISNSKAGGYGKAGVHQHNRLEEAAKLDRASALQACSWGKFQILGENWRDLKYKSLQEFVNCMYRSEAEHLDSFVRFIKRNNLDRYLRDKDWKSFARRYNGPAYARNQYDIKMANAYKKLKCV